MGRSFEMRSSLAFVSALVLSCARAPATQEVAREAPPALGAEPTGPPPTAPDAGEDVGAAVFAQIDPNGDDDPEDPGQGTLPSEAHFERVGRPPLALRRICDLTVFDDALYASHANEPLGTDGATITRYDPDDAPPFRVAFDWNRPGEPARGGGAGQGFLRVHAIGGRLFVPDTDPPYNGFGISEGGTEGFVFMSDSSGRFAKPLGPHFRPPGPPTPDGGAGAAVLPRAYHVLDVIRFRGRFYASTGSVPPTEHAWRGPSPGALHVANASLSRWTYEVDYPYPWRDGVWRLGFLERFRDRLYAGIQDYDGREPNDYVVFSPPPDSTAIGHADVHPARVTTGGAALTLRWYSHAGHLFWIALERDGRSTLRASDDGDNWRTIDLSPLAGRPTDITAFRDTLVVLAERGLYRLDGDTARLVVRIDDKKTPFELTDSFCAAPLAVYRNDLYAGSQRDGSLWRLSVGSPQ